MYTAAFFWFLLFVLFERVVGEAVPQSLPLFSNATESLSKPKLPLPTAIATPAWEAVASTQAPTSNPPAMSPTPRAPPSTTAPPASPPTSPSDCLRYKPCNLFYQYVQVLYWPEESPIHNNTACLAANPHPAAPKPDIPHMVSPSVYAVFPSIAASNGCHQIGPTFAYLTTSFAPHALSTIALDGSTQRFDYADLPCPPPDKGWDSSMGPYQPRIAAPDFLFDLDPAFKDCIAGAEQGIDPPDMLSKADEASPAGRPGGGKFGNRDRRALGHAHSVALIH